MIAIGCKYANVLIMDFMTKDIIRCFSLYEDYDLSANEDVDQFQHFRRLNQTYFEDDFVLMQRPPDEKEHDALMKRGPDFKKVISLEPKDKTKYKAQVASIDWSPDGRFIVVVFKNET